MRFLPQAPLADPHAKRHLFRGPLKYNFQSVSPILGRVAFSSRVPRVAALMGQPDRPSLTGLERQLSAL